MKIEYTKSKKEYPKLCEIPDGTVFSPINSIETYIRLDKSGRSGIFCDNYITLKNETLNIQSTDDDDCDDYSDIIAVAHLGRGTLKFMHKDTRVVPLECTLIVEE